VGPAHESICEHTTRLKNTISTEHRGLDSNKFIYICNMAHAGVTWLSTSSQKRKLFMQHCSLKRDMTLLVCVPQHPWVACSSLHTHNPGHFSLAVELRIQIIEHTGILIYPLFPHTKRISDWAQNTLGNSGRQIYCNPHLVRPWRFYPEIN